MTEEQGPGSRPGTGALPVPWDMRAGVRAWWTPSKPPPGANDPHFAPTPEHPRPVLLLHAFMSNQSFNFQAGAPFLRNHGYCVFTFNWGRPKWAGTLDVPFCGNADLRHSAEQLAEEVERIKELTGVDKVDLVGHSGGGGLLMQYYLNVLEGYPDVDKAISIAPSNHGVSFSTLTWVFRNVFPRSYHLLSRKLFPLADQGAVGSETVELIYGDGDTRPGPAYTVIMTEHDQIVTPYTRAFLDGDNVTNILLQDGCPDDYSEHASIIYNERAWLHVLNALDPANAVPVPAFRVDPYFPGWT
ncbi:alpha/beta fold hydrolase [Actinokineospora auranticolor]|uniref:Alpha/beta hydrolase family protein n=1 Tax=Actinokineospora auranticolor TaxID=155976 RepID=A0A2S6H209_9PSEU|nr:alpha/beta fold hydrolase [Actinokineospora auranticolor]PPK71460.1 alpha/beta hydrolase family protein [Actinokineospora auranticolor]